jgi:hypothetical protein
MNNIFFGQYDPPREQSEIRDTPRLIFLGEHHYGAPAITYACADPLGIPDCGGQTLAKDGVGGFQTHLHHLNWLFADTHAKSLKLMDTAVPQQMWDEIPDPKADVALQAEIAAYFKAAIKKYPEYR